MAGKRILPPSVVLLVIVMAQFACVTVWFAVNSVMGDLIREYGLTGEDLGHLTSMVQFGFISGTLLFAVFTLADRYSPSTVFLVSALAAAGSNIILIFAVGDITSIFMSRFFTGFFLAGIYPVGMKIAADYFSKDLGKALGYLVGALVIATAFPHLLKHFQSELSWKYVLISTSFLSVVGGMLVYICIPNGPLRQPDRGFSPGAFYSVFKKRDFRLVAMGYFGHMWELYAYWTFVPVAWVWIRSRSNWGMTNESLISFLIIGVGGVACVIGGYFARKTGSFYVAFYALLLSGVCCLVSPLFLNGQLWVALGFLLFWGMVVVMDSPQFSTLIAEAAPIGYKATALTIVTCIGFSLTIVSIQVLSVWLSAISPAWLFLLLLPGPVLGVFAMSYIPTSERRGSGNT